MEVITDFGNPGVLLALATLIGLWLAILSKPLDAAAWAACIVAVGVVTGALKTYFGACALSPLNIHSPSGHVAASTVTYGGLGLILGVGRGTRRHLVLGIGGSLWILAISLSRITMGAHTPEEVVAGLVIGIAVLLPYATYLRRHPPPRTLRWPLLGGVLLLAVGLRALPVRFEPYFIDVGQLLRQRIPWICPPA